MRFIEKTKLLLLNYTVYYCRSMLCMSPVKTLLGCARRNHPTTYYYVFGQKKHFFWNFNE